VRCVQKLNKEFDQYNVENIRIRIIKQERTICYDKPEIIARIIQIEIAQYQSG
jgi:hypothetical protein